MASRPPNPHALRHWFKALALSPGVLFSATYLLLHLGAAIYLNTAFISDLRALVLQQTNRQMELTVSSLTAGPSLNSITLKRIGLHPADGNSQARPQAILSMAFPCPDLGRLVFSGPMREARQRAVCDSILTYCAPPPQRSGGPAQ
ncbi:hypothetical protein [Pelodictyon luteolum]|uniref:Uncharacterized protein n=1 Tax=Chlorobium luteolum (strain DSM 273 / BCRC 81028 / 2530) TaxID=319225 RepID=Q3B2V3_CHLL3|nr:hypothetical protein [Pelodictyon luteolum]ABB24328.1 hypothetical protein Plut_1469 [Pelodictyon luteolum DSM 273]